MDFSVIIINYNLNEEVRRCINSLTSLINNADFEIILIDNHSEDHSIIKIAEELKQKLGNRLNLMRTDRNIGFGNACNLAAKHAKGDILFFLNPDTLITENVFSPVLREFNELKDIGIIGLKVSNQKYVDYSAGYFPNLFFEFLNILSLGRYCEAFYIKLYSLFSYEKKLNVHWVMGAAFLSGRNYLKKFPDLTPNIFFILKK